MPKYDFKLRRHIIQSITIQTVEGENIEVARNNLYKNLTAMAWHAEDIADMSDDDWFEECDDIEIV